jgi:hypothetical protein
MRLLQRNLPHESGTIGTTRTNINRLMAFRAQAATLLNHLRISKRLNNKLGLKLGHVNRTHIHSRFRLHRQRLIIITSTLIRHTATPEQNNWSERFGSNHVWHWGHMRWRNGFSGDPE